MFSLSPVHYDGWTINLTCLLPMTGEICDPPTRTFLIDPSGSTLEVAAAHAVAHLMLKHHLTTAGDFTEEHCDTADIEAERLLRTHTWQLLTNEPVVAVV